jgi:hypothetical protein
MKFNHINDSLDFSFNFFIILADLMGFLLILSLIITGVKN